MASTLQKGRPVMKAIQLPKPPAPVQLTVFLRPSFSMTVNGSQMSVQVRANTPAESVAVRS